MLKSMIRHHLVRPAPGARLGRGVELEAAPDAGRAARVEDWLACGRPLIVRRPGLAREGRAVCCGIPLPPPQGRLRIPVLVDWAAVRSVEAPPPLARCLEVAPESWQASLRALLAACATGDGAEPAVVGSLAWQWLTGLEYLREDSDADLVFAVGSRRALSVLDEVLAPWADRTDPRLDVEIRLAGDRSVAWREWRAGPPWLLVKSTAGVELAERTRLLEDVEA